jgi:hypothetical protein
MQGEKSFSFKNNDQKTLLSCLIYKTYIARAKMKV